MARREAGGAAGLPGPQALTGGGSLGGLNAPSEAWVLSPPLPLRARQLPERRQKALQRPGICVLDANLTERSGHGGVFTISTAMSPQTTPVFHKLVRHQSPADVPFLVNHTGLSTKPTRRKVCLRPHPRQPRWEPGPPPPAPVPSPPVPVPSPPVPQPPQGWQIIGTSPVSMPNLLPTPTHPGPTRRLDPSFCRPPASPPPPPVLCGSRSDPANLHNDEALQRGLGLGRVGKKYALSFRETQRAPWGPGGGGARQAGGGARSGQRARRAQLSSVAR